MAKKKHVHTYALYKIGGQRLSVCSGCGMRLNSNIKVDLTNAKLAIQTPKGLDGKSKSSTNSKGQKS